jgi:hypothetical protein
MKAYSSLFLFNINLQIAVSFQPKLRFPRFFLSHDPSNEPYPLVRSFKAFLLFVASILSCSYLFACLYASVGCLCDVRRSAIEEL